jgi:hypothetical protein
MVDFDKDMQKTKSGQCRGFMCKMGASTALLRIAKKNNNTIVLWVNGIIHCCR